MPFLKDKLLGIVSKLVDTIYKFLYALCTAGVVVVKIFSFVIWCMGLLVTLACMLSRTGGHKESQRENLSGQHERRTRLNVERHPTRRTRRPRTESSEGQVFAHTSTDARIPDSWTDRTPAADVPVDTDPARSISSGTLPSSSQSSYNQQGHTDASSTVLLTVAQTLKIAKGEFPGDRIPREANEVLESYMAGLWQCITAFDALSMTYPMNTQEMSVLLFYYGARYAGNRVAQKAIKEYWDSRSS
ncbi:hypothetical protein MMC28_006226 [Mycoblastus sanguinarius]|nr:hypothetical protein [Mycoblastus sanguinarius]